jgi:hypothetical protein
VRLLAAVRELLAAVTRRPALPEPEPEPVARARRTAQSGLFAVTPEED